jgi:hypothetical protein
LEASKGSRNKEKAIKATKATQSKEKATTLTKGTPSKDKALGETTKGTPNKYEVFKGTLNKDKEKALEACKGAATKDKSPRKTKQMKPPSPLDYNKKPSKKMNIIAITSEMESDDEDEPSSHYIPKNLGNVHDKTKDKKTQTTCHSYKIFANLF